MKRSRVRPAALTKEDWLVLASNPEIQDRIGTDDYCKAYRSIIEQVDAWESINWNRAIVALHIVYGWMPTIPKLEKTFSLDSDQRRAVITDLNDARQGARIRTEPLQRIKAFSNNSIVGGSKLLHFLRPDIYPIWDSRVAKEFLGRSTAANSLNRVDRYVEYCDTLQNWISDPVVESRCRELKKLSNDLADASDIRMVELVMFHTNPPKEKSADG